MAHFRKFVSSQDINKMYRVGFTRIVRWKLFERGVNLCVPLSIRCLPSGIFYISVDLCVPLSIRCLPSGIFYITRALCSSLYQMSASNKKNAHIRMSNFVSLSLSLLQCFTFGLNDISFWPKKYMFGPTKSINVMCSVQLQESRLYGGQHKSYNTVLPVIIGKEGSDHKRYAWPKHNFFQQMIPLSHLCFGPNLICPTMRCQLSERFYMGVNLCALLKRRIYDCHYLFCKKNICG